MNDQTLKLKSLAFQERINSNLVWNLNALDFDYFNLLLGNNASGKTRTFNILRHLSQIHRQSVPVKYETSNYQYEVTIVFERGGDEIKYWVKYDSADEKKGKPFTETTHKNNKVLFSRKDNILLNETTNEYINNFFLPGNVLAVNSIEGDDYPSLKSIKEFFYKMVFLEANRFSGDQIQVDRKALVLSSKGNNIGSVMQNWAEYNPSLYNEVMNIFSDIYPFIDSVDSEEIDLGTFKTPLFVMKEKGQNYPIRQTDWSDGMLRTLCLIALVSTRFADENDNINRPSLVCVDEIENGLDFRTLTKIIEHYESYSDLTQILISTHSPITCNLVSPKYWRLANRDGPNINITSPGKDEELDKKRTELLQSNWDFYSRHLAVKKRN